MGITETAQTVLEKRYYIGEEKEWGDLTGRVSNFFGKTDKEKSDFKKVLDNLDFLPNSPALMNAGTGINSFSACFVLPIDDNIESIYKFYGDAAKISKSGGGVGANYSKLRAKDSKVKSTNGVASGPLSFMGVQDASTETIKQGGRRRGANMGVLDCDHDDIFEFIRIKDDNEKLNNFNLSVRISDEFMESLDSDDKNSELWSELISRAWSSAEPGVLFGDTIERGNTVPHLGELVSTNPCLHPDTIIETVDGRVKIKDITEPIKVYTMEDDGALGIRKASRSWISKKNANVITIAVRSGKSITLTKNHKVYTQENGWIKAKDVKIGNNIVHLCRSRTSQHYSQVRLNTKKSNFQREHRFVAEGVWGKLLDTDDIHHIDGNTYNNSIDNLEILSHSEHSKINRQNHIYDYSVKDKKTGRFLNTGGYKGKTSIPMPDELKSKMMSRFGGSVVSILDAGKSDVYDISVEGTHNLIANFLVVHNCGELPLLPYENCTLGSINLANHIVCCDNIPSIDYDKLRNTVKTGVFFLNRILDANIMPIGECQKAMNLSRKIGLGFMGLHDLLIQLSLPYDSEEGRQKSKEVMSFIYSEANKISEKLGEKEGLYEGYIDGSPKRRNANLTCQAPTGTLSMLADCSSGCEPYYNVITRKTVLDGTEFIMVNKWFEKSLSLLPDEHDCFQMNSIKDIIEAVKKAGSVMIPEVPEELQDIFKGAGEIDPIAHVMMQAELQKYIDSSISKTINMPNSATIEDVKSVYELAYKTGCKGITIYRDGSRSEQVLTTTDKKGITPANPKQCLPDVLNAKRYRLRGQEGEPIYIIVCFGENEEPMEVFAKFPYDNRNESQNKAMMWTTVCRLVSLALRCGTPISEIIKQLDRSSGSMFDLPAQLGKLLKTFMSKTQNGYEKKCEECNGKIIFTEGCEKCESCGKSKCS